MDFGDPDETGGIRLNPRDIVNHLLLVWVVDYIAHSPTQYSRPDKPSDVIVVDAVDLDQVDEAGRPGLVARKCWWRQARLIQSLKSKIGGKDPLLVRMVKGGASMGFNAPYELTTMRADPQCVARATAWFAQNPGFTPSVAMPALPEVTASASPEYPPNVQRQDQSHWAQPEQPNLPPPRPVTPQEETLLERMARSSVPNQGQRPDQGPIPF